MKNTLSMILAVVVIIGIFAASPIFSDIIYAKTDVFDYSNPIEQSGAIHFDSWTGSQYKGDFTDKDGTVFSGVGMYVSGGGSGTASVMYNIPPSLSKFMAFISLDSIWCGTTAYGTSTFQVLLDDTLVFSKSYTETFSAELIEIEIPQNTSTIVLRVQQERGSSGNHACFFGMPGFESGEQASNSFEFDLDDLTGYYEGYFTNTAGQSTTHMTIYKDGIDYKVLYEWNSSGKDRSSLSTLTAGNNGTVYVDAGVWVLNPTGYSLFGTTFYEFDGVTLVGENDIGMEDRYTKITPAPAQEPPTVPPSKPDNISPWAVPEIIKAAEMNLIPNSLINPDTDYTKPISRAEFAGVAVKTYENISGRYAYPAVLSPFSDSNDLDVLKAFNTDLMIGTSVTEFSPNVQLNREQCATALTRVFKRITMPGWTFATDSEYKLQFARPVPFTDDSFISDWAKDSVYFMAANGIINGVGDNFFAPRATTNDEEARGYAQATREQALAIAVRMVENLH